MRRVIPAALGLALALAPFAIADERVIQYANDALTVHLTKVPLMDVLNEVARQSGAEVHGELRDPHEVSAEFEAVALPEALHRLLGDQNFALVYGTGGSLRVVKLLGGQVATSGATPVSAAPPPPSTVPSAADLAQLVANHAPVPVSGRLAEVVGGPTASLTQLFDLGVHHQDSQVRAEALRAVVSTLDLDPTLRSAVVGQMNSMDDAALSQLLRTTAGDHAEEVAMQVLSHARASEIRVKASMVLQRLRAGG
jgi:hypothetical protein